MNSKWNNWLYDNHRQLQMEAEADAEMFEEASALAVLVGPDAGDCVDYRELTELAEAIDEAAAVGLLESLQVLS